MEYLSEFFFCRNSSVVDEHKNMARPEFFKLPKLSGIIEFQGGSVTLNIHLAYVALGVGGSLVRASSL